MMSKNLILCALLACTGFASAAGSQTLSPGQHHIATVSALAAKGDQKALSQAIDSALEAGVSTDELKEALVQVYAYCGFPRSLNALRTLMEAVPEEGSDLATTSPQQPHLLGEKALSIGTENQTALCGAPIKGKLYEFAPAIDQYLKAHLFGDIFSHKAISWQTREVATIAMLAAMKGTENQLASHIRVGKHNGLTDGQIDAILAISRNVKHEDAFPLGAPADARVFTGKAWVSPLLGQDHGYDMACYNVTFAPGTRNNWHSHAKGQILLCTVGTGYYQEEGKPARQLHPGDVVEIPPHTMHWHGAAPDSVFSHIGITPRAGENSTSWGDPVTEEQYAEATQH